MKRSISLVLGLVFLFGCSSLPDEAPKKIAQNPWALTAQKPKRLVIIHAAISENRKTSLQESWNDAGVSFNESAVGYLKPGSPMDLGALLSGTAPRFENSATMKASDWEQFWEEALAKSPFDRHLGIGDETWAHAFELAKAMPKPITFRAHHAAPLLALRQALQEDWPFIFLSFDARTLENQPDWEKQFIAELGAAELKTPQAVLFLTYPGSATTPLPALKLKLPGIAGVTQSQKGILDTFTLKRSDLTHRARLASVLKQSGKFEIIFSKQTTSNRVHYIATYQKKSELFPPAFIEATFGTSGPDAIGVRSVEQLTNYISLPMWFWSANLKKSPVESSAHPTWLDATVYFDNHFGKGQGQVRDVFSTFLGSS